jgi:hypothetical protein
MLKNMAIHELALLATYWGVTVDNIKKVTPDTEFSSCQTLTGPSGKEYTDFSKVSLTPQPPHRLAPHRLNPPASHRLAA